MIIIRPIKKTDLPAYEKLALAASTGMTGLPKDHFKLEAKMEKSLESFIKHLHAPQDEFYLFVLEDIPTGEIGGTCGIYSKTGVSSPLYFFQIETIPSEYHTPLPNAPREIQVLKSVAHSNDSSEICALYLKPEFRREGLGRLLSLSRFLFMAAFPERFDKVVFAEMRGIIDDKDKSPFFEALERHFLNIEFKELMALLDTRRDFIGDIMPKHPIYTAILSKEAQEVIGAVHPSTKPALSMLLKEGFHYTGEIDPFDGGPRIAAKVSNIRTVANSTTTKLEQVTTEIVSSEQYLIANERMDFRCSFGNLKILPNKNAVLASDVATALQVQPGDKIRYILITH